MDIRSLSQQFLEYLKIDRGRSAKTIENYDRYLQRFFTFGNIKSPSDITEAKVRAFGLYLNRQPGTKNGMRAESMKLHTQNYYLIAIRAFLKFLNNRDFKTLSPTRISLAKVPGRAPLLITASELARLRAVIDKNTTLGKRDYAILELFISTGLRVAELCGLSIDDVDLLQNKLSVQGKGEKMRVVILATKANDALRTYIAARKDGDDALFIRHGRKQNDGGDPRLSPRAVQRMLTYYGAKAGITREVTPKTLRHCFAVNLLNSGADLRFVQAQLGHEHLASTEVYTKVTNTTPSALQKKDYSK